MTDPDPRNDIVMLFRDLGFREWSHRCKNACHGKRIPRATHEIVFNAKCYEDDCDQGSCRRLLLSCTRKISCRNSEAVGGVRGWYCGDTVSPKCECSQWRVQASHVLEPLLNTAGLSHSQNWVSSELRIQRDGIDVHRSISLRSPYSPSRSSGG